MMLRYHVERGRGVKRPWLVLLLLKNGDWKIISSHSTRERADLTAACLNRRQTPTNHKPAPELPEAG